MKGKVVTWILVVAAILGSMLSLGFLLKMLTNFSFVIE